MANSSKGAISQERMTDMRTVAAYLMLSTRNDFNRQHADRCVHHRSMLHALDLVAKQTHQSIAAAKHIHYVAQQRFAQSVNIKGANSSAVLPEQVLQWLVAASRVPLSMTASHGRRLVSAALSCKSRSGLKTLSLEGPVELVPSAPKGCSHKSSEAQTCKAYVGPLNLSFARSILNRLKPGAKVCYESQRP